jgi:PIN domain nuclease of toxin-antitoxin system
MRVLLDTYVFLWWINDDPRLSEHARAILRNADNTLHFSAASGWEIAIKVRTGKLELPSEPESFIVRELHNNQIRPFPIQLRHVLRTHVLPMLHRDSFDRMLIAQSQLESLPILTVDRAITQYAVDTIW